MTVETFPELASNLIYTVLCLVPGFLTIEVALHVSESEADLSEFEKSTWSLLASGLSLSALYFVYVASVALVTRRFRFVVPIDLQWTELVAAYPLLLGVAVLIGYLVGHLIVRVRTVETTRHTSGRERSTD
jgi:hypothetical protein